MVVFEWSAKADIPMLFCFCHKEAPGQYLNLCPQTARVQMQQTIYLNQGIELSLQGILSNNSLNQHSQ